MSVSTTVHFSFDGQEQETRSWWTGDWDRTAGLAGSDKKACGEIVRPNLNGNQGRPFSRKQELSSARVGIPRFQSRGGCQLLL